MAALADELLQRWSLYVLHDEEILAYLFNEVINGDSVWVSKRGRCTGFTTEAFDSTKVVLIQGAQYFNCHKPLYAVIPGLEDARHTSRSDMFKNLVPSGNPCAFKCIQCFTSSNLGEYSIRTFNIRG
jgi:hypothetical protein